MVEGSRLVKEGGKKEELKFNKSYFIGKGEGDISLVYKITKQILGKGSFSSVVKATHRATGNERAIKIILKSKIKNIERLQNELKIMRTVDHPNIVKLYEWFEDTEMVYLVLELCTGGEVFDYILKMGYCTEIVAKLIFKQMAAAVKYCHARNICHRDLKPNNFVFYEPSLSSPIKLIDFGLSRFLVSDENTGEYIKMKTRAGTPYYIAPEVLRGEYDQSCDMWSLGVILYVMCSGRPPFFGENDKAILKAVLKGKFDFLEEAWDEISSEVKDLICKLITLPDKRLKSREVLDHIWFTELMDFKEIDPHSLQKMGTSCINRMHSFHSALKLKKAVISYIATQLSTKEVEELRKTFNGLDNLNDGYLTYLQLKEGLRSLYSQNQMESIIYGVDANKNGKIEYNEFLAGALNKSIYLNEDKVLNAFEHFDKEKKGFLTAIELKEIIGANVEGDTRLYEEMIKEVDIDQNGMVDIDEFFRMMYNSYISPQIYIDQN